MMFAVMLTFAEVILQTIIGYKREQEKKFKHDVIGCKIGIIRPSFPENII